MASKHGPCRNIAGKAVFSVNPPPTWLTCPRHKGSFMKNAFLQQTLFAVALLATAGHAHAHSASGTIDGVGDNASATDLAQVICYDDGNGPPHHLYTQIQDFSAPVPGLLLSTQIFTDSKITNTTDTGPGDTLASYPAILVGPAGQDYQTYYISVSKTSAGARSFEITYHCQTANDTHTGTQITVYQIQ